VGYKEICRYRDILDKKPPNFTAPSKRVLERQKKPSSTLFEGAFVLYVLISQGCGYALPWAIIHHPFHG